MVVECQRSDLHSPTTSTTSTTSDSCTVPTKINSQICETCHNKPLDCCLLLFTLANNSFTFEIQAPPKKQHKMQMSTTSSSDGKPRPKLAITTAAVRNPVVTVEIETGGGSGDGREIRKSNC